MNADLIIAMETFNTGEYTAVLCKGDLTYTSMERGVKPLVAWIDSGIDLTGFSAADKIVGKAAAFLYVLLGVKGVYAQVISEAAIKVFAENGIDCQFDISVKNIINRAGTGICPMEETVENISSPFEALTAVKLKLTQLSKGIGETRLNQIMGIIKEKSE